MSAPRFFDRYLVRSMFSISGLMLTGDIIAQQLEDPSKSYVCDNDRFFKLPIPGFNREWNASRSARFATIGFISSGPISHCTYVLAFRLIPGTNWFDVAKKVGGIVVFNTPIQLSSTFTLTTFFAGGNLADAVKKIKRDMWKTWKVSATFWPPLLALNMKVVPLYSQPIVGGVGWAVWNIFLAYMANQR